MQFNLQVTILKMAYGVSFTSWQFLFFLDKHANADPTPPRHTHTQLSTLPILLLDWSTHQAVSAAVTEAVSCCTQAAGPVPQGLLLAKVPFTTAFHLFFFSYTPLICLSIFLWLLFPPWLSEQDLGSWC